MAFESFYILILPAALFVVYMSVFEMEILMLAVVFLTPLAINVKDNDVRLGLSLPTEPIIAGMLVIFILKTVYQGGFDKRILKHPITLAIIFHLAWMFITCITSEMPIVSIKFFTARLWFVCSFYFMATQLFANYKNTKRFIWLYAIGLLIVVIYTIYNHALYFFSEQAAHWVMTPFYNDHTAYAMALAMFIPPMLCMAFNATDSRTSRFIAGSIAFVLLVATILSYTRAAWLGLVGALIVYLVFLFKVKFKYLFAAGIGLLVLFFLFQTQILLKLQSNHQDSSSNYTQHLKSMSNISTDASNRERINRWNSAFRMFKERPVFGWGPGVYMFKYAPFQHSSEMTIISTNAGNMGNAHSEYIGPLAESGVLGSLSFILIMIMVIYKAAVLYVRTKQKEIKILIMGTMLGLITYYVHGIVNNFLDTDKAAVPFWGFIAMIVALEVYHTPTKAPEILEGTTTGKQGDIV